jgi:hypothetical protein
VGVGVAVGMQVVGGTDDVNAASSTGFGGSHVADKAVMGGETERNRTGSKHLQGMCQLQGFLQVAAMRLM